MNIEQERTMYEAWLDSISAHSHRTGVIRTNRQNLYDMDLDRGFIIWRDARAAIEADRKRRGEPVGYISREKLDWLMAPGRDRTAACTVSVEKSVRHGLVDHVPIYASPQPTEQSRGEPVTWPLASKEESDMGWTLDYRFLEQVEKVASQRTDFTTSMEAAEQVLIAAAELLRAPQPLSESDIPAEPDSAKCAECGAELIHVRPGKWQHPDCSQSSWAADLVSKTDWNNELSSWSDEDFIRIFNECPDLANRLRKMLAEPVKGTCKKCNGTGVESTRFHGVWPNGEECLEPIKCDQCDGFGTASAAEPVKVDAEASVPSDTDIDELSREWGLASAAYPSKSMVRDFSRALLARYK